MKKRPSMKDVAELAGVSRTTVSFVLNEKEGANIPDSTRQRVLRAVHTLGYRPNELARGLRSRRTATIGFISDVVATTPFAGQIIQGAQGRAWEDEYLLLMVSTGADQSIKRASVETLLDRQVDGILYATMWHREVSPPAAIRQVPTVLLDCYVADRSLPSVVPDEVRGGHEATDYLIAHGHHRIGFVNDEADYAAARGRLDGYRDALAAAGIPSDPALIVSAASTAAGAERAVSRLLDLPEPPTALFCFNDRMALGAYMAARERGIRIPDELAVVGFDNHEIIVSFLRPGLTTMQLPHHEMGRWAVDHLLALINGDWPPSEPVQHVLHCPLVERESV